MSPSPQPPPTPPSASGHLDAGHDSGPRKRKRRAQYALRACDNCRNRKVKCCGKLPCKRCIDRSENCAYQLSEHLEAYQIAGGVFSAELQQSQNTVELQRRVGELELEIGRLKIRAASMAEESESSKSPDFPFSEEPDTFQLHNCALQSKFRALMDAIPDYKPSPLLPPPDLDDPIHAEFTKAKILLPEPATLHKLLGRFFNSMNPYLPCIARPKFEERLLHILCESQYPKAGLELKLCSRDVAFMALVAVVLAQAQHFEQEESGMDSSTRDWEYYHQSRSLVRNQRRKGQELDLIRVHTLSSMYLVQKERLADACQLVVTAIVIAQACGLNNQSSWPKDLPPVERVERKCIFWTTYYQDRRVAEKFGQPYFLRDSEVDVDDFTIESQDAADYCNLAYMQNTVAWARLWGEVWDVFFAMRARKNISHAASFASMDFRVQQIIQGLPPDLTFSPHNVKSHYDGSGDIRTRYRLLTFMRFNLLRLILQHNPLVGLPTNAGTLSLILELSSETIVGICNYLSVFPDSKSQIGVITSAALVDCVCHLVPPLLKLLRTKSEGEATRKGIGALRSAKTVLSMLAETSGAASRASKILQPIFNVMNDTFSILNPEVLPAENRTSLASFDWSWKNLQGSGSAAQDSTNWDIGGLEGLGSVFTPSFDLAQESWLDFSQEVFDASSVVI